MQVLNLELPIPLTGKRLSHRQLFFICISLVIFLFIKDVRALDTLHLTIENCIAMALKESPSARIARLDSVVAAHSWRATRAESYPQLNLSGEIPNLMESVDYRIVYDPATDKDEFKRISSGDQRWYGRVEIEQALPWGAELNISSGLYRTTWYDDRISSGEDTTDYSLRRRFSLTQPILAGNPVGRKREIGRINWQTDLIDHELQIRQIVFDVKHLFFRLVSTTRALEISRQDLEQVREAEDLARRKLNAGLIPEVELLQIQVELARREGDFRQAESAVESAADRLKTALGIPMHNHIVVYWKSGEHQILDQTEIDIVGERLELIRDRMNLRRMKLENLLHAAQGVFLNLLPFVLRELTGFGNNLAGDFHFTKIMEKSAYS